MHLGDGVELGGQAEGTLAGSLRDTRLAACIGSQSGWRMPGWIETTAALPSRFHRAMALHALGLLLHRGVSLAILGVALKN